MPRCRENRRRRLKRRKKHERRLAEKRLQEELANCWLCCCGNYIEDGLHCTMCGAEPPFGCPCSGCQDGDGEGDYDGCEPDDSYLEPCGSCEWCGANIYPGDYGVMDELCDQCAWGAEQ